MTSAHMMLMKTSATTPKPGPRGRKNYIKTVTYPDGYVREFLPPMGYTMHAEGDVTFGKKGRGVAHRGRLPRKIKKWVRRELNFGPWQPFWTNHATRVSTPLPAGVIR